MEARRIPAIAVLVLAVAVASLVACDEGELVVVQNNTAQTVVVYEDNFPTELIAPGVSHEFGTHEFRGTLTFAVRYLCDTDVCDQGILTERTFTWEEMQQAGGITLTVGSAAFNEP